MSVPTVLSPAKPDDITNAMLANPVAELTALRVQPPLANLHAVNISSGGRGAIVPEVLARHYDSIITFKGLQMLSRAELEALSLQIHIFAPVSRNGSDDHDDPAPIQSWYGPTAAPARGDIPEPPSNTTGIKSNDPLGDACR